MKRKYFKHADMAMCVWLNLHKNETTGFIYLKVRINHHWDCFPFPIAETNMDFLREVEDTSTGFTSFYVELL